QEYRRRHKDGTYRWISVRAIPLYDEHGNLYKLIGTQLDITDQKAAQESLLQSAQHDGLTGLPNRTLLYEFAEHLVAAARRSNSRLAVLFFDLDRFKAVNDTYGHKVGDGVLKEMARRLDDLMRAEDVIGRLGGDEFVAVLPKTRSQEDAARVAMKARDALGKPYVIGGIELNLSPSIGISLFPKDGGDIDTLIHNADEAMYEAKKEGYSNIRFFTARADRAPSRQNDFGQRLRLGLEHGEFDLHYQPVIDIGSGQVVGVEALLRWPRMNGDAARPASLIALAEASGQMLPLGDWILRQACHQHQTWLLHGLPPIAIAVNVSPVQLRRTEFQESIQRVLAATGMDPTFLEIEVTEGTVMKSLARAQDVLQAIKNLGLKIVLDELGTGYSSLVKLSHLPIDKLKISGTLVRHLTSDKSRLAIVDAIVALAVSLGVDVVAEGVESEDDLNALKERRCHHAQGFYLGWPMPGQRFEKWYTQRGSLGRQG
ncbi:MAG TPA: EAL domain-containing protein, partial [Burkholderiaceae bacterium]|nr:EAL domain-containing protein [Burkholderiaceae bacterium]